MTFQHLGVPCKIRLKINVERVVKTSAGATVTKIPQKFIEGKNNLILEKKEISWFVCLTV